MDRFLPSLGNDVFLSLSKVLDDSSDKGYVLSLTLGADVALLKPVAGS